MERSALLFLAFMSVDKRFEKSITSPWLRVSVSDFFISDSRFPILKVSALRTPHSTLLFHRGAGGLYGDHTADGYGEGGGAEYDGDGLVGGASVGYEVMSAVHADVVAGTVPVVVLRKRGTSID